MADRLVQPPPVPRKWSRAAALLIVAILLLGILAGGCARVRAALAVRPTTP